MFFQLFKKRYFKAQDVRSETVNLVSFLIIKSEIVLITISQDFYKHQMKYVRKYLILEIYSQILVIDIAVIVFNIKQLIL